MCTGRACGQTGFPLGILGDDPQMDFPRSPMSPRDVGVLLSISVSPIGDTSQRRGSGGTDIPQA